MSTTKDEHCKCWDELKNFIDNPNKPIKGYDLLGVLLACIEDLDERLVEIEKQK